MNYTGRDWSVDHNQTFQASNAKIKYAVVGEGEPIICVHGTTLADSLITPLRLYTPLFDKYQFISYYRAGYNGSTLEKDSLSIEEGADHIKELLKHLNIKKAHLLAFSFGGVIGMQFILKYSEMLKSAILLEPYLPRESKEAIDANTDAFMKAYGLYSQGLKVEAALQYMEDVCGKDFFSAVDMTGPLDVWERMKQSIDTTFQIDFPAISNWDFKMSEALKNINPKPEIQVLAMMGFLSEAQMPGFRETQRFLMEFFPNASRCGILGATHGMQSMNPLAVGEGIFNFLQNLK
jgi:pimeloyl-ACP methyl ester carboxylesterase